MRITLNAATSWKSRLALSGDKSLSHRSLILASMASGSSHVTGLSKGADVASTADCLRATGAQIEIPEPGQAYVSGWGSAGPSEPTGILDCGNSGTSLRLLAGVYAAAPSGLFVLDGDASLRSRPQGRIIRPLNSMGGQLMARADDTYLPLVIRGGALKGFEGRPDVASAQVKSRLLLAGVGAGQEIRLRELGRTRDHTERMLRSLGVPLSSDGLDVHLPPGPHHWDGFKFAVPGDPSSAAFLVAAAVLGDRTNVVLEDVCLNPTRMGFYEILTRMGARLEITETGERMGEPVGTIEAHSSRLVGTVVEPEEVPTAIDEFPLLAVVATAAEGHTTVKGAHELRVKESDRIGTVVTELSKMGARIKEEPDGFTVYGPSQLQGAALECHHDHRMEMSLAVAGLMAEGSTHLLNAGWASISFPEFWDWFPGEWEQVEA